MIYSHCNQQTSFEAKIQEILQEVKIEASQCPREGCPEPEVVDVEREDFFRKWSNATQWPGERLPAAEESVVVEEMWKLIMDIDIPKLDSLIVKGELIFDESKKSTLLEANTIQIIVSRKYPHSRTSLRILTVHAYLK